MNCVRSVVVCRSLCWHPNIIVKIDLSNCFCTDFLQDACFCFVRAAMKMANIDAVLDFMFTSPKDRFGVRTSVACTVVFV